MRVVNGMARGNERQRKIGYDGSALLRPGGEAMMNFEYFQRSELLVVELTDFGCSPAPENRIVDAGCKPSRLGRGLGLTALRS